MAEPTIRVSILRAGFDDPDDHTFGCGQPPEDYQPGQRFKTGTVCAGAGTLPSCGLCPHSPSYHRLDRPSPIAASTVPAPDVWVVPDHEGLLDWSKAAGDARGVEHNDNYRARPCRYCGGETHLRDASGKPSHKVCAEANGQTNDDVGMLYRRGGDKHGA
jgi:hypothetical protein